MVNVELNKQTRLSKHLASPSENSTNKVRGEQRRFPLTYSTGLLFHQFAIAGALGFVET